MILLACLVFASCAAQPPTSQSTAAQPPPPGQPTTAAPQPTTPVRTTATLAPPAGTPEQLSGTIIIDGSSTVFPITEAASIAFRSFAPQVEIRLGVSGSSGGFKKFCAGETLISDASRPISADEAQACAQAGIGYIELPIAFDGISVMVHPDNTWASCVTVAELKALWAPEAEGVVTRWSQLHQGWPNTPISLYGAGGDSGTFDYFTHAIVGTERSSRKDYVASEDDYLLAQDLAADPAGLGFFGYAYYVEYEGRLRALEIDNGEGCVAPSATSIADGSYQPLSRPIFLYVRADALDRPEVHAFIDFYLTNGPALVRQARYIPLPDSAYPLVARRVENRITGSVFSGGSQVGVSIEEILQLEGRQ
ncbi:PstS family phosphate ABC transporter substrate-binding protein [Oscillochloris sp. ZM17-4]|nr:PstS family phosphate ABC transporter substrate-binding protein [Oscillochloris sp. ZM17-4]MBX0329488.1 PstS family phosphate ABC transporter substrate-binding protein [Oscillochloris sp. ZM17-4]